MKEKARRHFDSIAEGYGEFLSSRRVGVLRKGEVQKVMEALSPAEGEEILDAGCGPGAYSTLIKELRAVPYGIDLSPEMVEQTRRRGVSAEVGDLEELDLGRRFDKVLCAGVLEFCGDPEAALLNLAAHLKEGGTLVFLFPVRSPLTVLYWLYHLTHGMRINLFARGEIRVLLERAGLTEVEICRASVFTCVARGKLRATSPSSGGARPR